MTVEYKQPVPLRDVVITMNENQARILKKLIGVTSVNDLTRIGVDRDAANNFLNLYEILTQGL